MLPMCAAFVVGEVDDDMPAPDPDDDIAPPVLPDDVDGDDGVVAVGIFDIVPLPLDGLVDVVWALATPAAAINAIVRIAVLMQASSGLPRYLTKRPLRHAVPQREPAR